MSAALVLIRAMGRANKEVLPLLKVVGGGVVKLLFAIITEHQTGEHIALTRCCSAVSLLSDFLHLIKYFQRNNRPFLWIVGTCLVAIRNVHGQTLTTFALCLVDRTDFTAGIFCEKLIEPVLDTCNIVVRAVGVNGVEVVVDGNLFDSLLSNLVEIAKRTNAVNGQDERLSRH